ADGPTGTGDSEVPEPEARNRRPGPVVYHSPPATQTPPPGGTAMPWRSFVTPLAWTSHVPPPLTVLKITPESPTAHPVSGPEKRTPYRTGVPGGGDCAVHVEPPLAVLKIAPPAAAGVLPTAQPVVALTKWTPCNRAALVP